MITPHHESRQSLYQTVNLFRVFLIESLLLTVASYKSRELSLVFAYLLGVTSFLFQNILMRLEYESEMKSLSRLTIGIEVLKGFQWQSFRVLYGGCTGKCLILYC